MDPATPLSANLQRIRVQRGWSYDDASAATGLDAEVLRGIEHGSTFISSVTVDHLAERLGVHRRELTG